MGFGRWSTVDGRWISAYNERAKPFWRGPLTRATLLILSTLVTLSNANAAHIEDLKMTVDGIGTNQPLKVTLDYRLSFEDSILQIPLKALCHRETAIENVVINLNGQILEITFDDRKFPLITGNLILLETIQRRKESRLIILYEVKSTVVPLLLVDWKPKEAKPQSFQAKISLPKSYFIFETFPTIPWNHQSSEYAEQYNFDLQVIPAWIKWQARKGAIPFLTFYRKIDLFVIFTFLLIAFLIGRHLKRNAL